MTQINIFYNIKASRRPSSVGRAHGSYPYGHRFNPYGRYSNLKKVAFFLPFANFIRPYFLPFANFIRPYFLSVCQFYQAIFLSVCQFYQSIFFVRLTVLSGYIFCHLPVLSGHIFCPFDSFIKLYFLPFASQRFCQFKASVVFDLEQSGKKKSRKQKTVFASYSDHKKMSINLHDLLSKA